MTLKIDGVNRFRGFERVTNRKNKTDKVAVIPERATENSAGHDFVLLEPVTIKPMTMVQIWTDIKAYMQPKEMLLILPRSSFGTKYHVMLVNTAGVIDSDYYNNANNEGNIGIGLWNYGANEVTLPAEAFAQGIFLEYLITDNDNVKTKRVGGYGSTGK